MPTYLYHSQIEAKDNELMLKVWSPTPWMDNVYTGSPDSPRYLTIMQWCVDNFGRESWPIHDSPRDWYSGNATVNGYTWMGFKTEEMMDKFLDWLIAVDLDYDHDSSMDNVSDETINAILHEE